MEKYFKITYDVITGTVAIDTDMSVFEAFGMLEAAKIMVAERWDNKLEEE